MKKVSGFTLVELLAVILVLAIVLSIAVIFVLGFLRDSQVRTCENLKRAIQREAESYVLRHHPNANNRQVTLGNLFNAGLLERPITNPVTNERLNENTVIVTITVNNHGVVTNNTISGMECES